MLKRFNKSTSEKCGVGKARPIPSNEESGRDIGDGNRIALGERGRVEMKRDFYFCPRGKRGVPVKFGCFAMNRVD